MESERIGKLLLMLLLIAACLYGGTQCGGSQQEGGGAPNDGSEGAGPKEPPPQTGSTSQAPEETTMVEGTTAGGQGGLEIIVDASEQAGDAPPPGEQTGAPLPTDPLHEVDQELDQLRSQLKFNTPKQMQMGEPTRIVLVLGRTGTSQQKTPKEMSAAVRQQGGKEGQIVGEENIVAAERMRAQLSGTDFQIEPLDSPIQPLTSEHLTTWHWDVTPTEWGKKSLHLSVTAFTGGTPFTVESYDKDIMVNVTMKSRLIAYVSFIPEAITAPVILAILGAIAAWFLAWWRGWWSKVWAKIRATPPER